MNPTSSYSNSYLYFQASKSEKIQFHFSLSSAALLICVKIRNRIIRKMPDRKKEREREERRNDYVLPGALHWPA